ncbi:MAG: hypothetical protein NTY64_22570, partial [Deltaproteobacteria bacterium]|nr:hypothetical protein [Deltaproteobacteria bacterium]
TILLKMETNFSLSGDPTQLKAELGETVLYPLTITPLSGFSGEVSLSPESYPPGFTVFFTPNPVPVSGGPAASVLKLIPTSQAQIGSYPIKVKGQAGGLSRTLDLKLDVTDVQMDVTPERQRIGQVEGASFTIRLEPVNGFEGPVALEVEGIHRGMRANLSANPVTLPSEVTLTLETSKWLMPGEYSVNVVAKGKVIKHTKPIILTVDPNPILTPKIVVVPGPGQNSQIPGRMFDGQGRLLHEFPVPNSGGDVHLAVGDVDGDGYDEMIAGTNGGGFWGRQYVEILKRDGTPVASIRLDYPSKDGVTVATADLDGDWFEEIAVGSYIPHGSGQNGLGMVRIYKLAGQTLLDTGLVLYPYAEAGYTEAPNIAFGDVDGDGDGVPELITAPGPDP